MFHSVNTNCLLWDRSDTSMSLLSCCLFRASHRGSSTVTSGPVWVLGPSPNPSVSYLSRAAIPRKKRMPWRTRSETPSSSTSGSPKALPRAVSIWGAKPWTGTSAPSQASMLAEGLPVLQAAKGPNKLWGRSFLLVLLHSPLATPSDGPWGTGNCFRAKEAKPVPGSRNSETVVDTEQPCRGVFPPWQDCPVDSQCLLHLHPWTCLSSWGPVCWEQLWALDGGFQLSRTRWKGSRFGTQRLPSCHR